MNPAILQISGEPIGAGQERVCYQHPDDESKVVKIQKGDSDKQTRRELALYASLARRGMNDYVHIPRFHGAVQTNLGSGFVVDRVADYDGAVSRSLWWHFERGYPVTEFLPYLEELRCYLVDKRIVFSVDMGRYNILFQKLSPSRAHLVVIDGLGNHTAINWLDNIGFFARRKIQRRWQRFIDRLHNYSAETMHQHEGSPRKLGAAYRNQ
ncbi:MAG: hypothetical protein GY875_17925 [Gammaproteobacteria bacterium]|nr:hypothetical protein [Gammaproteobacteria bacterium]